MAKAKTNAAKTKKALTPQKAQKAAEAAKAKKVEKKAKTPQNASQKAPKASGEFGYRPTGNYHFCCAALFKLGVGKHHPHDAVVAEVRKQMGPTAWKTFAGKDARNEETGKEAAARVIQNCAVLARKKTESSDYAGPLRAKGYRIEFDGREKTAAMMKIGK